ncbi:MAG: hypothetical protein PHH47_01885 [Gallionella sp.]|nr:hypothetical protein [Gallionella sp.]MDD4945663.1 hypothetical protein [Gallionella sp.]
MSRSLFSRLFLICALLFAQMGAVTHSIAHTLADRATEHTLSHDKHCDLCEAYNQIGGAVGSTSQPFLSEPPQQTPLASLVVAPTGDIHIAYPARAPPCPA